MSKRVGIIIPFYNGDNYITRCVDSITSNAKADNIEVSIYIVDNNIVETKVDFSVYDCLKHVKAKPQIGYGRACNLGSLIAMENGEEYLIFLNQDAYVYENMVVELVRILDTADKPSIVSPMIFDYDSDQIKNMVVRNFLIANNQYFTDTHKGQMKDRYVLPHIGAACIGMKKEVIDSIGLYDPIFHMYVEDIDLMERLNKNGGQVLLAPKAKVAHFHSMNEKEEDKRFTSSVNYNVSQLIRVIRYSPQVSLRNFFLKNLWSIYRNEGLNQMKKYFKRGVEIYRNQNKYKELPISELKIKIAEYQNNDIVK